MIDLPLLKRLEFLAGLEAHGFAGRDGDFCARTRIAADAGFTGFHGKDAEAAEFDPVAMFQSPFHFFKHGLHGHFGLGLGDTGLVDHFVDDIELDQTILLNAAPQTDDRIRVILMSSKTDSGLTAPVDPVLYRQTCARFATGITVVTVVDEHGHPHGMTVNSFSSVSLDPPLVLVSIDLRHAILGHFLNSRFFAINILAEHQEHLSRHFSSTRENRFSDVEWHAGETGVPLLEGVLAHLECAVSRTFAAGDHTVLLGEVRFARYSAEQPLVYFGSSYRNLGKAPL